jgi:exodeoxyribonuclease VII large subunit
MEILFRLTKEGLLELNKRLCVPMLPQRIGLITSKGSAAYNDLLKIFSSLMFGFKIYLADAIVQGLQTEKSVLHALNILEKLGVDLMIIARGGGSKTELFNLENEAIARRIAEYKHPVWTGIVQGTRKLLDLTKGYLMGYATMLSSRVQGRLSTEKSIMATSRKVLSTAPVNLIKRSSECLKEKTDRFNTGYARQLTDRMKYLSLLKKRFLPSRFLQRLQQEHESVCGRRDRFVQRFKSEIQTRIETFSYLASRFRLEPIMASIENEIIKLTNKGDLVKPLSQIQVADVLITRISDGHIESTVNKTERKENA